MHATPRPECPKSRLYLNVEIFNVDGDANYFPTMLEAVIDTGAQISVVPRRVLDHFGTKNVRLGKSGPLRVFNGASVPSVESFLVHMRLHGFRPNDQGRLSVMTRDLWSEPILCVAVPMDQLDTDGSHLEQVILGMDFLRRCRLHIDGPGNQEMLTLFPDEPRH
jgi:hypothetical protein